MGIVFSGSSWCSVCFFYVDGHAFPPFFGKFSSVHYGKHFLHLWCEKPFPSSLTVHAAPEVLCVRSYVRNSVVVETQAGRICGGGENRRSVRTTSWFFKCVAFSLTE